MFNKDVKVIIGNTAKEGIMATMQILTGKTTWEEFQIFFKENVPRWLLNISYTHEITSRDQLTVDSIVQYYLESYEQTHQNGL